MKEFENNGKELNMDDLEMVTGGLNLSGVGDKVVRLFSSDEEKSNPAPVQPDTSTSRPATFKA